MKKFFVICLYKIILEMTYWLVISKTWDYGGSILDFNIHKYIISWIIFLIFSLLISKNKKSIMDIGLFLLFIFSGIPGITLFGLKNISYNAIFLFSMYWLMMIIAFKGIGKIKLNFNIEISGRLSTFLKVLFCLFGSVFIIYASGKYAGFRFTLSLDVSELRSYRMEIRSIELPTIIAYGLPLTVTVIFPILGSYFFSRKKYKIVVAMMFLIILAFSINGMKSWIVYLPLTIIIYILSNRYRYEEIDYKILIGFIIIVLIGTISALVFDNIGIAALSSYRSLYLPAEINFHYFDFFNRQEALFLRESILRRFFESPYPIRSSFLVGQIMSGNLLNNANNGLFGDAYSNFKEAGILIYPFLIASTIKILESLGKNVNKGIVIGALLCLVWGAVNVSFFTWLVTGGVILTYVLIIIISSECKKDGNRIK